MICPNCGTNCADGMKFCVICGNPFNAAPQPETPAQPETTSVYSNNYDEPYRMTAAPASSTRRESSYIPMSEMTEANLPEKLKPLSPWAYVGYMLLFSMLPCAGLIIALVFAFSDSGNVNRKNFSRGYLLMMLLSLVITIIIYAFLFIVVGAGMIDIIGGYY